MARFSVVIPAYNAEQTVAETIEAVLAQTHDDWECVVVNDGSTDGTARVVESYEGRESRLRVVTQENMGSAGAYNAGARAAAGEFVVVCSADDTLLPTHLEEMAAFIEREPGYDIYSTNGYFWKPDGSREMVYPPGERDEVASLSLADVITVCFYSVGAAYRRIWYDRIGGYRVDVWGEDYDFWLRAMASGAAHRYLPSALSLHRVSPTQKSADLERAYRSDIRLVTDLRDMFELPEDAQRAVDQTVHRRLVLIRRLRWHRRFHAVLRMAWKATAAVIGDERTHRLAQRLRGAGPREQSGHE